MLINNYFRGSTDKLSGFVYDTEKKTYREYVLKAEVWSEEYWKNNTLYSSPKKKFKDPADISYFFPTKTDMLKRLETIKKLKFKEDVKMILNFGVCRL